MLVLKVKCDELHVQLLENRISWRDELPDTNSCVRV